MRAHTYTRMLPLSPLEHQHAMYRGLGGTRLRNLLSSCSTVGLAPDDDGDDDDDGGDDDGDGDAVTCDCPVAGPH